MKGTKYTAREKEKALKLWLNSGRDYYWIAKKTKCAIGATDIIIVRTPPCAAKTENAVGSRRYKSARNCWTN